MALSSVLADPSFLFHRQTVMSSDGSDKGKGRLMEESNGEKLQSYLANMPEDILAALMGELEKRIQRNSAIDVSNNSSRPSEKQSDDSRGKNRYSTEKKKGKGRLKQRQCSTSSCNMQDEAETSKQGAKRKSSSIMLNKHVVLSASSSSSEDDGSDSEHSDSPDSPDLEKQVVDVDLSYNVQFRRLSNSEVCFFKGELLRDEAGREFEQKAADALKLYCREVDKHFKEIKPRYLQRTLKYIYEQFGDGLNEMDIIRFLKKRWRHWRDNLRRNVRAGNAARPMQVDEQAWKRFVQSCDKVYQRQKDAAAHRKKRQQTGSGGLMAIKTKFFQDWGSMPTDDMIQDILDKGGYEVFKKKMVAKGFVPKKHKALDYVKGKSPRIIFKAKSKKGTEIKTSKVCYVDSESDKEEENNGECSREKNGVGEGACGSPQHEDDHGDGDN